MNKLPRDGYFRSELVEVLQRQGFDLSAEQLRKYEVYELFSPMKMENGYRIYTKEVVEKIQRVLWMKIVGLSLRRIKEFFALEEQIMNNDLLVKREVGIDRATGEKMYIKELPPLDCIEDDTSVDMFLIDTQKYITMCDEVNERINKVVQILGTAASNNIEKKEAVNIMSQVR